MNNKCRFCSIVENKNNEKIYGEIDSPFLEDKDFLSLVSIGAFIDGWTLLITKKHKYNLKNNYNQCSFFKYLNKHVNFIRKKLEWNDKVIVFEHGANKCDSETACGTSHAHLHILPFKDSILTDIKKEKKWIKCVWSDVPNIVGEKEYLLYCENIEQGMESNVFIHIVDEPESQFFRRVLFQKLGLKGSYSYKEEQYAEESMRIIKLLKE